MKKVYSVLCLTVCSLAVPYHAHGENEEVPSDSVRVYKKIAKGTRELVRSLDRTDDAYITPNYYDWTVMLQNSNYGEKYKLSNGKQTIEFAPNFTYRLGAYIGWRWLFLGYSFDIGSLFKHNNNAPKKDLQFSLYTSRVGCDLYYRKTGNSSTIKSITDENGRTKFNNLHFTGLNVSMKGINAYYIFNYKHFSYPAAFAQSTNQRRSCGTFKLGFLYSEHNVRFDVKAMPASVIGRLDTARFYNRVKYKDYALTFGYAYNWVFAKNWLACLSLDPALGFKKSEIQARKNENILKYFIRNLNFDVVGRAAVVWNNSKYYAGASLITNTYDYRKTAFTLTSTFGILNFYVGMNFCPKKKYRKKNKTITNQETD